MSCIYDMFDEKKKEINLKVLSLDFDDCIIPWSLVDNGSDFQGVIKNKDKYNTLKQAIARNLDILRRLQQKIGFRVTIHSSWGQIWYLDDNYEGFDNLVIWFRNQFNKRFKIFGVDKNNNRDKFLLNLKKQHPYSIIVALDDFNLSELEKDDIIYIPTFGIINKEIKEKIIDSFKSNKKTKKNKKKEIK